MAIVKKDRFFGEGVAPSGAETALAALEQHRDYVRQQRLKDALGKDASLGVPQISHKFGEIVSAIKAADDQVAADNKELLEEYGLFINGLTGVMK